MINFPKGRPASPTSRVDQSAVLVDVLTGLLEKARTEPDLRSRAAAYYEAARLLDTPEVEAIEPDIRQHLFTLYAEAHMIATGALCP